MVTIKTFSTKLAHLPVLAALSMISTLYTASSSTAVEMNTGSNNSSPKTNSSTSSAKTNPIAPKNCSIYKFVSRLNGQEDSYALRISHQTEHNTGSKSNSRNQSAIPSDTLLIYLHSLSGDFSEPFRINSDLVLADTINKEFPSLSILSCNYGKSPSWGNSVARMDITSNLRQVMKQLPVKHIVLIGTSMGASTALTYAATAPSYIKDKIMGLVTVCPCADLEDLYRLTQSPEVKSSLEEALGGNPDDKPSIYGQNSFNTYLAFLPERIKIGIISASEDTMVPILLQKDLVRDLNNRNLNTKLFEIEGKGEPPPDKSILEALRFVLSR